MSDIAKQYANEIYFVFKELEQIIPDLSSRPLEAKNPTWLPLKAKKGSATVRDYIVRLYSITSTTNYEYEQLNQSDLVSTCPVYFDIESNARNFQVDHFYSRAKMMDDLDKLCANQDLLKQIKRELKELFSKDLSLQQKAEHVVDKLISYDEKIHQFEVVGLKNIYYNYPNNLWAMSSIANESKSSNEPIENTIVHTCNRLDNLLGGKDFSMKLMRTTRKQLKLEELSEDKITPQLLSDEIKVAFNNNGINNQTSILPNFMDNGKRISLLDFYKRLEIGKQSIRFAQETTKHAAEAIVLARDLANQRMKAEISQNLGDIKTARSRNRASIFIIRILRSILGKRTSNIKKSIDNITSQHSESSDERMLTEAKDISKEVAQSIQAHVIKERTTVLQTANYSQQGKNEELYHSAVSAGGGTFKPATRGSSLSDIAEDIQNKEGKRDLQLKDASDTEGNSPENKRRRFE